MAMACTNMSSSRSQLVTSPKELSKKGNKICRTFSGIDLLKQVKMQRFYSDIHLCHSVNQIHASKTEPKLKNSWSLHVFKFHLSGSFLAKSLPNFSIEPETRKETNVADDHVKHDEMEEKKREMYKREDWVERILQIRACWIPKQQIDEVDNDSFASEDGDTDGEKCEADSYKEVEGNEEFDRETFSKLLKDVSRSDTKLLSQSAFLCNMSYAISEMMVWFVYLVLHHFNRFP